MGRQSLQVLHNMCSYMSGFPTVSGHLKMHWRDQRQRSSDGEPGAILTPVLAAVVTILLTACLGTMFLMQLAAFDPPVGAIVVFKPSAQSMDLWNVSASAVSNSDADPVSAAVTRACVLSPGRMAKGGGSLVVEARQMTSPPIYRVHWAGSRTSDGSDDCGNTADLVLSRSDLQKLANTAGGYGVGPKMIGP
jgi:hypothetical protein